MHVTTLAILLFVAGGLMLAYGFATRRERTATPEMGQRLERFGAMEQTFGDAIGSTRTPNIVAQRVDNAVQGKSFADSIAALMARADIRMTVGEFLIVRAGSAAFAFLLGFLIGRGVTAPFIGLLVGCVVGLLGWMAPHWYISLRAGRRMNAFVNQLGDTITLMSNSLRAGYSLLQTMELIARESPPPMSQEFRRVVQEVGLGISAQEAMAHLLRRVPSEDLDLMVTAINIQHEVGGNLAQILDVIGETIRERVRIKGEIRVLTAQQSISGYIISGLPIALAGFLIFINPQYEMGMLHFPWICMPIGGLLLIGAGFLVMRKITNIEV